MHEEPLHFFDIQIVSYHLFHTVAVCSYHTSGTHLYRYISKLDNNRYKHLEHSTCVKTYCFDISHSCAAHLFRVRC